MRVESADERKNRVKEGLTLAGREVHGEEGPREGRAQRRKTGSEKDLMGRRIDGAEGLLKGRPDRRKSWGKKF
jgi:hypothetical protein